MDKSKSVQTNRLLIINHLVALLTVTVWGVTFVSTKVLIQQGLSPTTIFILRFALAYACTLPFSHGRLFAGSLKDEICLMSAGITGGSLYFITENSALGLTFASNVSLIICCAPIFTMFLGRAIFKDKLSKLAWVGTLTAFVGVGFVVHNGSSNFSLNLLGDFLTLVAALSWAVYCILLKNLNLHYSNLFINRKIFFYGIVTALIWTAIDGSVSFSGIRWTTLGVIGNLLFLGIGASFLCYLMWNRAVKAIGVERTANYIYLVPLVTIVASTIFLHEPVTLTMLLGASLIIVGVFLSTR